MLRIVKLYKASTNAVKEKKEGEENEEEEFLQEMMRKKAEEENKRGEEDLPEESKVGKQLSEVTTRKVIIMVLVVMLSVPLFSVSTYITETKSFQLGLDFIATFDDDYNGTAFSNAFNSYRDFHSTLRTPIFYVEARELFYSDDSVNEELLRDTEKAYYFPSNEDAFEYYMAIVDSRADTKLEAIFGISQTIFVCIVLTIGAFMFTQDATELVIGPIEQMMGKVKRIASNPLEAAKEEEDEAVAIRNVERDQRKLNKKRCFKVKDECNLLGKKARKNGNCQATTDYSKDGFSSGSRTWRSRK
jgi:hypothetical protein